MVKLSTARESRLYGPRRVRNRWELINAGLYVFATILLMGGFAAQLSTSGDAKSGLFVILIALALLTVVNLHDLVAHVAGIDYRWPLMWSDTQLALVEFAVPLVQALGSILTFLGIVFLLVKAEKWNTYRLEKHALDLLIAGPALWLLGSILNLCQVYERADSHVQILQNSVQIPFLMGSILFLLGGILNSRGHFGLIHHGLMLLGKTWIWLCMTGSLLFFIGGLFNVVKVFKMQQMDGVRLENLRGGGQERLSRAREGQVPLILEDQRRRPHHVEESRPLPIPTPYKDALVTGQS
ncbi:polypyrimidine tract-binding-like protein [Tasmannia lanceolata]|uniref:polypyrimidine tract-binding-like protein n=1 Tax=Tasmannia lanceolata TaxID=3420 RepID=UPI00406439A8